MNTTTENLTTEVETTENLTAVMVKQFGMFDMTIDDNMAIAKIGLPDDYWEKSPVDEDKIKAYREYEEQYTLGIVNEIRPALIATREAELDIDKLELEIELPFNTTTFLSLDAKMEKRDKDNNIIVEPSIYMTTLQPEITIFDDAMDELIDLFTDDVEVDTGDK